VLVFLLSAAVGMWAAYDRQAALEKFRVIVGAVLIFYALARQPRENIWMIAGIFTLAGVLVALNFLLGHDWLADPTGIAALDQLGVRWMALRPLIEMGSLHPNIAGGLLGMSLPFALGLTWRNRVENGAERGAARRLILASRIAGTAASLLIGVALVLTSSRGALLASLAALGIWGLWLASSYLTRESSSSGDRIQPRVKWFLIALAVAGIPILFLLLQSGSSLLDFASHLPGASSGESRVTLARDAYLLIDDFWYTGAGLRSFAGLYSHYIMGTPFFLFSYSHNFYLDVALEQGLFGFLALTFMLAVSIWQLGKLALRQRMRSPLQVLTGAGFASLLIVILHGIVDDALYSGPGTPLLFSLVGLAAALEGTATVEERGAGWIPSWIESRRSDPQWINIEMASKITLAVALLGMLVMWRKPLIAEWYADLGALEMARVELAGFPTGKWDDGSNLDLLAPAEQYFEIALELDEGNLTAHHRLGLIAKSRGEFQAAIAHLERAYLDAPAHRGIRKALGYSYAWAGDFYKASLLFKDLPETARELQNYVGWWARHDRQDLSDQAKMMAAYLESSSH
jgi:tetratricopeptide (TPR) repeat protein